MDLYSDLFESMVSCCGKIGFRHGPVYTIAMIALGLGVSLNILSVIDLLWTLGLVNNPYESGGGLHPQRYLCALLGAAFVINSLLARLKFTAEHRTRWMSRHTVSAAAAAVYVLGSTCVFLITLRM